MHWASWLEPVTALVAVLLLIVVLGRLAGHLRVPVLARARGGGPARLAVRTSLAIDPKRRLMIVACDGREGLILLGPQGEVMLGWLDVTVRSAP